MINYIFQEVHTGTRAASPKHRALWNKKSLEVGRADRTNDALHSVRTQVAVQARSQGTLVSNENVNANVSHLNLKKRDIRSHTESEKMSYRLQKALLSRLESFLCLQYFTCGRRNKQTHVSNKKADINLAVYILTTTQQRSEAKSTRLGFFSAVQELAKMCPPSVPRPKYSLLRAGSSGSRLTGASMARWRTGASRRGPVGRLPRLVARRLAGTSSSSPAMTAPPNLLAGCQQMG
jgi:hypothetical protein